MIVNTPQRGIDPGCQIVLQEKYPLTTPEVLARHGRAAADEGT